MAPDVARVRRRRSTRARRLLGGFAGSPRPPSLSLQADEDHDGVLSETEVATLLAKVPSSNATVSCKDLVASERRITVATLLVELGFANDRGSVRVAFSDMLAQASNHVVHTDLVS